MVMSSTQVVTDLAQGPSMRTPWHALVRDPEVPGLVVQYAQVEQDLARARASLEHLVTLCRPVAEQIARTYTSCEADIADIVQDALVLLARDLPDLRTPTAFPQWFATL